MPVLARAFLLLVLVFSIIGGTVYSVASRRVHRIHDVPAPPISRATSAQEVARGGRLFRTICLDCHAGADGATTPSGERRPAGGRVMGAPSFLGEIWAPNLTADRETGIGNWTDGELARLVRNGLGRDGRYAASMPRFARLADPDVAALIGFLRSQDPLVAPVHNEVPRPGLAVAGTLALAFAAGVDTAGAARVPMPPRGHTAAYGGYLASAVYGCVECHTEGRRSGEDKFLSPVLMAGGQIHRTPQGEPIYSANLTPDPDSSLSKLAGPEELGRLLNTGLRADGLAVRPPMPIFRYVDADEAAALHAYLRSVPAVARRTPGPPRPAVVAGAPPEQLFVALGCPVCHGEKAPHRALLKQAATRPAEELAAAIRNPERLRPHSQMPTYAAALDEGAARRLATWIIAGAGKP